MIRVTITCPISWYEQCLWITDNCAEWKDETCWAAWQIGYDDIYFWMPKEDAVVFKLRFGV